MSDFHVKGDGPLETWQLEGAARFFNNQEHEIAYHKLFQSANARIQRYFITIGVRINHEDTRDWAMSKMIDEATKMNLSYNDNKSMAQVLDMGYKSAKRNYNNRQPLDDEEKVQLKDKAQWETHHSNVTEFQDAMDKLAENSAFEIRILSALLSGHPDDIQYTKETWTEEYEHEKYVVHHHFFPKFVSHGTRHMTEAEMETLRNATTNY
ncbi:hypothetical protein GCK72_001450 [Caenorhabditis remanei]|uniref:Uncharacterized protein n=1 Tax=Caenorhabditis remanei TaxID=31234 RepID=E3MFD4_CAERE|nr:hypothetical protein GCK72_001450 [Caenorhabditis remanei]EFP01005.1 hypothetical protein CRE_20748 [Caenorhabditis remanei]KAF1769633.1 hypothetical protein GCK72_001450 [Caenorhabditis remanei]